MSEATDPIFAKIAKRYDRINQILSLGRQDAWRVIGVDMLEPGTILDLGCGPGNTDFGDRSVVGLDPVVEMLELSDESARVAAIGESLPIRTESMGSVFSAFVFRNLTSVDDTLAEIERVLVPGGVAVVIDLGRPFNRMWRGLHWLGTAVILPLVGLLFAGAPREYWYLHMSLGSLPQPHELYAGRSLVLEEVWRAGMFGFVYGVRLRKPLLAMAVDPEAA